MLALLEPCIMKDILDRPHLGCAMLIAACLEKGIKTTLIKGQTRYLKDMFVNDSEELWRLIQDLKEDDLKKMVGIGEYKKSIQEKGLRQFQDELKSLYQYVIIDKNPRHYFNAILIEKFTNLSRNFMTLYFYYLKKFNHTKLKIVDRYVSEIIKSNPRYIGFSLQGHFDPLSRTIRKRIKELTEIPIIVGGALTPFIDLKKLDKIFEEEYFDYLVIGCGDHALPSLIKTLENNKNPKGITNVFYKKGSRIIDNDLGIIDDLDELPYPDYSQFDLDLYLTPKRILPLQTARGCSWSKCAFCSHHKIYQGKYRTFSIEKVIKTIKHLQNNYNCSHFVFHDDELPPVRAKRISEAILSNKVKNINIHAPVRLENGYNNSALLQLMRKAGFVQLHWGVESGNQRVLNLINKGTNIKTTSQILRKSFKSGIGNICFIFFGFPGETQREAQQTVEFLKKHAKYIEEVSLGPFAFDFNSPIGKNPGKWGVDIKADGSYSTKNGMNSEELNVFYSELVKGLEINSTKITSDKFKYLLPGHCRVMLRFLISSHVLLSDTILRRYIRGGELNKIFLIILGEIKKKGGRTMFRPINTTETCLINQYHPEKEKVLDSLEEEIFILSDGTLSIEDVCFIICNNFKTRNEKEYIYKKCINFFRELFSKNFGLCFAKSWRLS